MAKQITCYSFLMSRTHYLRILLPFLTPAKIYNLTISFFSYLVGRKSSGIAPCLLTILLTSRCNYSCIMCKKSSKVENFYTHLTDIDFDKLTEVLKENAKYLILVKLTGGEPICYKEFFRLIDLLGELNIPYCLFTNFSLLTPELCRKLLKCCLWISISLDAANTNIYKKIRRNGKMELIKANLEVLNKIKHEHYSKTPLLNVSMTTFTFNLEEMTALVRFCYQYRISGLTIGEGKLYNKPCLREKHLIKYHINELNKTVKESKRLAKKLGVIIRYNFPCLKKTKTETTKVNLDLYLSALIYPDLNVYMNPNDSTQVGNIHKNSLKQIWNGVDSGFTALRGKRVSSTFVILKRIGKSFITMQCLLTKSFYQYSKRMH
ncbi:MAG: radical SAM protein [Candidatus Scalindua sp.]|nr:radical SAM protein [Candidatus Scalindua sp.]